MGKKITLAAIGCGSRTQVYTSVAASMGDKYEIIAAADPIPQSVEKVKAISKNPNFKAFNSDKEILAQDKLADVMIIGTQDDYHYEPCVEAMKKGYDIILEKPVADTIEKIVKLQQAALKYGRNVTVCYVLRYTPFYKKVKELIDSGKLGDIISINAVEGVEPWHQSHSFVRGHWAVAEKSTPMIIAKSCHDIDIIHWLTSSKFSNISSFGRTSYFNSDNDPVGAPQRCTDGCPHSKTCLYDARKYISENREWLPHILADSDSMTDSQVEDWLKKSKWGRCVFKCKNTAVDHQVLSFEFESGASGTFTMSAFTYGRQLQILGTKASLYGWTINKLSNDADIMLHDHLTNKTEKIDVAIPEEGGYGHHGGGDYGIIKDFYDSYTSESQETDSKIDSATHSHLAAFAAEKARVSGQVVNVEEFYNSFLKTI